MQQAQPPIRALLTIIAGLWLTAGACGTAHAVGCPVDIMRVGTRYVRDSLQVLQRCELEIRDGLLGLLVILIAACNSGGSGGY